MTPEGRATQEATGQVGRWWMLRYPSGVVHMASEQDAARAGEEARRVGARAFVVVRAEESDVLPHLPWRVGRKVGRTIYAQRGIEPRDDDPLIGTMDTKALAREAVDAHNAILGKDAEPRP